jgi:SAM-dependent methyltransferase
MARERRLSFGGVAELYDRSRPSYPAALIDEVIEFAGDPPRALEVGAGTGKATVLFVARGVRVQAIEPSAEMAAIARRNAPEASIEESDFERFAAGDARFPLIYSAQAWHWVDPAVGYPKARDLLEPGGALALFWNRQLWERSLVREELRAAYARTAPQFGTEPGPMHPDTDTDPELWGDWEPELRASAGFASHERRGYTWTQQYSSAEYCSLLQTHSDHILLGPERLGALLDAVAGVIDAHGGTIPVSYATVLLLARAD